MVDFEEIITEPDKETNEIAAPETREAEKDKEDKPEELTPNENTEKDRKADRLASIEGQKAPSLSGAARLRALRKKRFKQKKLVAGDAESVAAVKSNDDEKKEISDQSSQVVDEVTADTTVSSSNEAVNNAENSQAVNDKEKSLPPLEGKKWKGVAAIRRQKVLEKRQKDQEEAQRSEEKAKEMIEKMTPVKKNMAPYYELMILALLFFSGFFIGGLQKESIIIKSGFHYMTPSEQVLEADSIPKLQTEYDTDIIGVEDEFSFAADKSLSEGVIDPIFRVDLDKYTEGDSILMTSARFAVRVHRKIIYFPGKILQNPPTLLIIALFLRKIIKVPKTTDAIPDADNMMTTAINFISSFFPGLVSLYEAYKRAKLDVNIMFVGFLLGAIISTIKIRNSDEL